MSILGDQIGLSRSTSAAIQPYLNDLVQGQFTAEVKGAKPRPPVTNKSAQPFPLHLSDNIKTDQMMKQVLSEKEQLEELFKDIEQEKLKYKDLHKASHHPEVIGGAQNHTSSGKTPPGTYTATTTHDNHTHTYTVTKAIPPQTDPVEDPLWKRIPPIQWTVSQVIEWLEDVGYDHLSDKFEKNGVDGATLLQLSRADLVDELDVPDINANVLMRVLASLVTSSNAYQTGWNKPPPGKPNTVVPMQGTEQYYAQRVADKRRQEEMAAEEREREEARLKEESQMAQVKLASAPAPKHPDQWTTEEVCVWLHKQGFEGYSGIFTRNGVDGETLLALTEEDLKEELDISNRSDVLSLKAAIAKLGKS
eukprot:TRINITY_DN64734_c0_g1_i1.p1 TRINITY_DN64734_c0_g1~~TRINITY_DN64734_c0_g1_i1.p1  ORF type:complete len:363 (-),score=48.50 TRINITY_DN64734_c0_g1_i1:1030-2118(-)